MTEEKEKKKEECHHHKKGDPCGASGALYFFGFIGAAVYYIQVSDTFWMGVLGFLKAIVWPAFLVYQLLQSFI